MPRLLPPTTLAPAPTGERRRSSAARLRRQRPPAAPPTPPGAPRPFAEVIKDAKALKGFLTLWQKDDKTWIEIRGDLLDKPFFLSPSLARDRRAFLLARPDGQS